MKKECPEAEADIDVLIRELAKRGPSPAGYDVKDVGQGKMRSLADQLEGPKATDKNLVCPE